MKIAAVVHGFKAPEVLFDTVDSIEFWMTDKIQVLIDGANWEAFENYPTSYQVIKGLVHGYHKSPYRNQLFGLQTLYERYPDEDFYCWIEYDCLVMSDWFKQDLQRGWCYGTNHRKGEWKWDTPLLTNILDEPIKEKHYFIGNIMFFANAFLFKLKAINFFNQLIDVTTEVEKGEFPGYDGYSFEEELLPSIANLWYPGSVVPLAPWERYACRWKPSLKVEELPATSTIAHPIKDYNDPIRKYYRKIRNARHK